MEASHKTHRPHIKVGKDEEEEDLRLLLQYDGFTATEILIGNGSLFAT